MSEIEYEDIPVNSVFLRYEGVNTSPVALLVRTIEGNAYVIPFTGSQVYEDNLGGKDIISPTTPVKTDVPVVVTITATYVDGTGPPNEEITVLITTGGVKETKTTQSDEWGYWLITVTALPDEVTPIGKEKKPKKSKNPPVIPVVDPKGKV